MPRHYCLVCCLRRYPRAPGFILTSIFYYDPITITVGGMLLRGILKTWAKCFFSLKLILLELLEMRMMCEMKQSLINHTRGGVMLVRARERNSIQGVHYVHLQIAQYVTGLWKL